MIRDSVEAIQLTERYGFVHYFRDRLFDSVMLYWFNLMVKEDTLRTTMCLETPSDFLRFFDPERIDVLMKLRPDTREPWFVGWIDRTYSGGTANVWSAKDKHGKKSTLEAIEDTIEIASLLYPVLVATTRPNLLDAHSRLGYHILGTIPKLWNENDVVVVYMNRGDLVRRTRKRERQQQALARRQQQLQRQAQQRQDDDGFVFGTYADAGVDTETARISAAQAADARRPRGIVSRIREI